MKLGKSESVKSEKNIRNSILDYILYIPKEHNTPVYNIQRPSVNNKAEGLFIVKNEKQILHIEEEAQFLSITPYYVRVDVKDENQAKLSFHLKNFIPILLLGLVCLFNILFFIASYFVKKSMIKKIKGIVG